MLSKKACCALSTASSSILRPHVLSALPLQAYQGYSGLMCSQHCLIKHTKHTQASFALSTASPNIRRPHVLSALPLQASKGHQTRTHIVTAASILRRIVSHALAQGRRAAILNRTRACKAAALGAANQDQPLSTAERPSVQTTQQV